MTEQAGPSAWTVTPQPPVSRRVLPAFSFIPQLFPQLSRRFLSPSSVSGTAQAPVLDNGGSWFDKEAAQGHEGWDRAWEDSGCGG